MSRSQQFALFAAMLVCALGAPVTDMYKEVKTPAAQGTIKDYRVGKTLALKLNEKARQLYEKVETSNSVATVIDPPLMIRPEDKCDPDSLKAKPETCLSRAALALKNYSKTFGNSGIFQGQNSKCDKWRANATAISELTEQILEVLQIQSESSTSVMDQGTKTYQWMESYLCRDSVERLYSFSIVMARVFSHLSLLPQPA